MRISYQLVRIFLFQEDVMDLQLLIEYLWVFIILIGLEGLLAADNALVLAVMVKHLPEQQRKKALFYGLAGAFILRFGSLFIISFLVNVWQVQAVGAAYLLFISGKHLRSEEHTSELQLRGHLVCRLLLPLPL